MYDKVLAKNEKYEYSWKFNLSNGSKAFFDIDENIKTKIKSIAIDIINKLEVKFVSIDIVEIDNQFFVLEMNSGVMIENLINMIDDISKLENIYEKAILSMFKE